VLHEFAAAVVIIKKNIHEIKNALKVPGTNNFDAFMLCEMNIMRFSHSAQTK